jgi:hypothetical protein
MKTLVKTRVSTGTRVVIVVVALLMLGIAGYGFGIASKINFPITPQQLGKQSLVTQPLYTETKSLPINKPSLTVFPTEKIPVSEKGVYLYTFRFDHALPSNGKNITFKQIGFVVSLPKGMKISDFILEDDNQSLLTPEPSSIKAIAFKQPQDVLDVKKGSSDYIEGFDEGYDDTYYVFASFDKEYLLPEFGSKFALIAQVTGSIKKGSVIRVNLHFSFPQDLTYGDVALKKTAEYGGSLVGNYDSLQWKTGLFSDKSVLLPDPGVFHILRVSPMFKTLNLNTLPNLLWHLYPTIWSDHSSASHNPSSGFDGGSADWFKFIYEEDLLKYSIYQVIKF